MVLKTRIQVFSFPKDPKLLFYFDTKDNPKGKTVLLISRQQSTCVYSWDRYLGGGNVTILEFHFHIIISGCDY